MCDSICQPELVLFWDHADQNMPTKALKSIKAKIITSELGGLFPSVTADISLRTGQVEASLGCNFCGHYEHLMTSTRNNRTWNREHRGVNTWAKLNCNKQWSCTMPDDWQEREYECKKMSCIPPWCVTYSSTTLKKIINMSFIHVLTLLLHTMCQKLLLHASFTRNKFHNY